MYLKDIKFKDIDENIHIGKAIKCVKLKRILNKLPLDCLINTNAITGDILIMDKELNNIGYIDIGEDKFEKFE